MSITYLTRFFINNYLIVIPAIIMAAALVVFAYIGFEHTTAGKAIFYQRLSQKFPYGSVNQKRFM